MEATDATPLSRRGTSLAPLVGDVLPQKLRSPFLIHRRRLHQLTLRNDRRTAIR